MPFLLSNQQCQSTKGYKKVFKSKFTGSTHIHTQNSQQNMDTSTGTLTCNLQLCKLWSSRRLCRRHSMLDYKSVSSLLHFTYSVTTSTTRMHAVIRLKLSKDCYKHKGRTGHIKQTGHVPSVLLEERCDRETANDWDENMSRWEFTVIAKKYIT